MWRRPVPPRDERYLPEVVEFEEPLRSFRKRRSYDVCETTLGPSTRDPAVGNKDRYFLGSCSISCGALSITIAEASLRSGTSNRSTRARFHWLFLKVSSEPSVRNSTARREGSTKTAAWSMQALGPSSTKGKKTRHLAFPTPSQSKLGASSGMAIATHGTARSSFLRSFSASVRKTRLGKVCNVSYLKRRASGSNADPLAVYAHRNIAAKGTFDSPSLLRIVFHAAHLFGELRRPAGGRSRRFNTGPFLKRFSTISPITTRRRVFRNSSDLLASSHMSRRSSLRSDSFGNEAPGKPVRVACSAVPTVRLSGSRKIVCW